MDLVKTVSNVLGIVCVVIGVLLLPMGGWFLWNGIKTKRAVYYVIAGLVLVLAAACGIGAYTLFTQGIMKLAPM